MKKSIVFLSIMFLGLNGYAAIPDTAWVRYFNSPENGTDRAMDCVVDNLGHFYVTGNTEYDIYQYGYLIKYDADSGDTIWTRRYEGFGNSCAIDTSGHLYVVGKYYNGADRNLSVIKFDADSGDTLWIRTYVCQAEESAEGKGCALDDSGNLYVVGNVSGDMYEDCITIKYDAGTGDTIWTRRYRNLNTVYRFNYASSCAVDPAGYLYVAGASCNDGGNDDCLLLKYDPLTGDSLWVSKYIGPDDKEDIFYDCTITGVGDIYATGKTEGENAADLLLIKYDAVTGDTVWMRRLDGEAHGEDYGRSCVVDNSNNLYIAGGTFFDIWTLRYNANTGDTVWTSRFSSTSGVSDFGAGCATDAAGNIYVAGYSGNDIVSIKYAAGVVGVSMKPETIAGSGKLNMSNIFPNPSKGMVAINYQTSGLSKIRLGIYDITGKLVKVVDVGRQQDGNHQLVCDFNAMANGIYFCRLDNGFTTVTKKLILLR